MRMVHTFALKPTQIAGGNYKGENAKWRIFFKNSCNLLPSIFQYMSMQTSFSHLVASTVITLETLVKFFNNLPFIFFILCRWTQKIFFLYVVEHLLILKKPFRRGKMLAFGLQKYLLINHSWFTYVLVSVGVFTNLYYLSNKPDDKILLLVLEPQFVQI